MKFLKQNITLIDTNEHWDILMLQLVNVHID